MSLDKARALENAAAMFDAPRDVLRAEHLSLDEKRLALERWKQDAIQLQAANDENMTGGTPTRLEEIVEALKVLDRASG